MKNIITISGEPVSGKGTVVKLLKEYYEEHGIKVHIISVGHMFRDIAIDAYKKDHPEIENPTIEQVNNDERFAERRKEIDLNLDSYIAQKGKEVSETIGPDELYIFDSRLAFSNIPNSFSVRLTVDEKVAGERVFKDASRGEEDKYDSLEDAIESTKRRKEGEIARYKARYGVDLTDEDNYKLVIDTSMTNLEDIIEVISKSFELEKQGKHYAKTWRSPQWFLPLQDIRSTGGTGAMGMDSNEFEVMLRKEGYNYDCPITVIQVDGYYYIIEGHHRNFVMGFMKKTLVPYDVIARDDEIIPGTHNTARQRIEPFLRKDNKNYFLSMIYDHEDIFPKKIENEKKRPYYYTDIYGEYPKEKETQKIDVEEKER